MQQQTQLVSTPQITSHTIKDKKNGNENGSRINYRFQVFNFRQSDVLDALVLNSPPMLRRERKDSILAIIQEDGVTTTEFKRAQSLNENSVKRNRRTESWDTTSDYNSDDGGDDDVRRKYSKDDLENKTKEELINIICSLQGKVTPNLHSKKENRKHGTVKSLVKMFQDKYKT